ncbi:MAG: hypothetical protein K2K94_01230 [Muribaculaceae bacterium]|nr:hypothetical protein [Muribaculaceae bacterium]
MGLAFSHTTPWVSLRSTQGYFLTTRAASLAELIISASAFPQRGSPENSC